MYDLNQPNDVIAQMRDGNMTDRQIVNVCERVIAELKLEGVAQDNTCWNCNEPCDLFSEYQDDARTFCSLDCMNEATEGEE